MARDIYQELRMIGLTSDQCCDVMELIAGLPVVKEVGADDVNVDIFDGTIHITKY